MALVDFMYKGEVNVEQEQLASFLNTAELLEVQGLTNSGKEVDKSKKTADEVYINNFKGCSFLTNCNLQSKTATPLEGHPEISTAPFNPPFIPLEESSQSSPSSSVARKRRRTSPNRTEDESQPKGILPSFF
jgi:hypothetical protein